MESFAEADTKIQWFQDDYPGSLLRLTEKTMVVCLHTTESMGWPGYDGGAVAPNATGFAPLKGKSVGKWRKHFPDDRSSRALQNDSGGVETNTLNCYQIELIGTCDSAHAKTWAGKKAGVDYIYWGDPTKEQCQFVGEALANLHKKHGLRLVAPKTFLPYPQSYGQTNPNRLTFAQWRNTTGVVGHQHVPENDHGDPGDIPIGKILKSARALV